MRPHVQFRRFFVLMLVALALPACARRQAYVAAPSDVAEPAQGQPAPIVLGNEGAYAPAGLTNYDTPYQLDAGDRLRIQVFGQEGLTNSYIVDAAGCISMSLVGSVSARGLTTAELARAISARLRNGYVRNPHVSVEVEAYRPFFILGEVNAPGQYPYVPNMSVEAAIAIAGGYAPRASKTDIILSRNFYGQIFRGPVPPEFSMRPGDTITVKARWF